ncbi:Tyrosyl-DNA phosphodiesterase 1 [Bienertia sinuspersici]
MVRRVVFQEELVGPGFDGLQIERPRLIRPLLPGNMNKRVFAVKVSDLESSRLECDEVVGRAKSLSAHCHQIVCSDDPVSCIRRCISLPPSIGETCDSFIKENKVLGFEPSIKNNPPTKGAPIVAGVKEHPFDNNDVDGIRCLRDTIIDSTTSTVAFGEKLFSVPKAHTSYQNGLTGASFSSFDNYKTSKSSEPICMDGKAIDQDDVQDKFHPPPGKNFYLNGLYSMHQGPSGQDKEVSLQELLHPVDSILRLFIATFTSDIEWFLSHCEIPYQMPVTVACHNTERCWSGDPKIAFGKDRKNRGVGCHHPKLLVLQREQSMRVIITSANLVAKQWQSVTNTIWWQDFPRSKSPDCTSLFNHYSGNMNDELKSDFAAQLAGFMAILMTDVPSEARWIIELTKYDFSGANGYLVASVPGIHSYRPLSAVSPACKFENSKMLLGSVEASVVGYGLSEILLRREKNVSSDANAVSVVVPNPTELAKGDCVQLGFLPRAVAKWVSPLWDMGFLRFCGHLCPKEALAAAFRGNGLKVQLTLHGPNFLGMPKMMDSEHVAAFCSLVASLRRCTGLWRMEEETSVSAQFLAAFSAAAGKRSHLFDSEESDQSGDGGLQTDELKDPSMRIIFPTIDRVRSAHVDTTVKTPPFAFQIYGPRDKPATKRAMSEALAELAKEGRVSDLAAVEETVEDVPDEDDEVEVLNCVVHEEDDEKAYADALWHQVDSSQSC